MPTALVRSTNGGKCAVREKRQLQNDISFVAVLHERDGGRRRNAYQDDISVVNKQNALTSEDKVLLQRLKSEILYTCWARICCHRNVIFWSVFHTRTLQYVLLDTDSSHEWLTEYKETPPLYCTIRDVGPICVIFSHPSFSVYTGDLALVRAPPRFCTSKGNSVIECVSK